MKTSARNELAGKIVEVKSGQVMSEIKVEVAAGVVISALITKEATDSLDLTVGSDICTLIKSSSVILSKEVLQATARNVIKGEIKELIKGQVNTEIKLSVGDNTICAIVTNDAVDDLGFKEGEIAYAIFKASSVILVF
ncbi:TOBE domain-containing protein [Halarcobacter anaerophilus]|jgi:molybdate transport system regulatory protein|uniref:Molybdenum-pterin-binding protein n=1 Tax=Halarcobacter anaerophilus TaxID=877500 RepID=A0A4Q0Y394_9BACT|nr:TOBE domain-containing protein [Halarcobacter anaerophilus]QDF29369.1 molybdenum-pterin binding domain-containing protein [Halarcobacter anaerophilus]RXJ64616.1 molybdenum-pterin-binding protein [Halarcobacter anaerophilus]